MLIDKNGIKFLYQFLHLTKPSITELTKEQIQAIQYNCHPRLPGEEFPELYPDPTGDTGLNLTLYRGFYFPERKAYESFLEEIKEGIFTAEELQSWTRAKHIARTFATGAGQQVTEEGLGVILKIDKLEDLSQALFCAQQVYTVIESEFDFDEEEWDGEEEYLHWKGSEQFFDESEVALLPGSYVVTVEKR